MHDFVTMLAWERITSIAPQLEPLSDEEVADGDGFPVRRRWMNQTHRTNAGSNSVREFCLRFDQIRTRHVIIKLIERFIF